MYAEIAVATPLRLTFDYLIPPLLQNKISIGARVKVPFGRREVIAIVTDIKTSSPIAKGKLKSILELIDEHALFTTTQLQLLHWVSDYYHHSLGEVINNALPKLLREGKPAKLKPLISLGSPTLPMTITLNDEQETAVKHIVAANNTFQRFLLSGITGSGKTEVYMETLQRLVHENKQALILIPEIGLTPQTLQRFQQRFVIPVLAYHSGLSEGERLQTWAACRTDQALIVIGTRSAVFLPFRHLQLLIIDEEHDLSFKQQDNVRYHARDVAIRRAQIENIPIVLGSATPALESLYNVKQQRYKLLELTQRAGKALVPNFKLIDLRQQPLVSGLAPTTLAAIKITLEKGEQVLLFLNRRGYAPVFMCHDCGWIADCSRCDAHLTVHQQPNCLRCHHCDQQSKTPLHCPQCDSKNLLKIGIGTEQLEEELTHLFSDYHISRIDRDTTRRKQAMQEHLTDIHSGKTKLLLGTQMLAKGHHFPNVTLVVILNLDNGFFSADFRTIERVGQLIIQVAGRAGRAEKPGTVLIQTHQPDNELLQQLIQQGYLSFAETLLSERRLAVLPPFSYWAILRAEAHQTHHNEEFLQTAKHYLQAFALAGLTILGPMPAPLPKRAGRYRMQLYIQSSQRAILKQAAEKLCLELETLKISRHVRWSLDIDPQEMF